MNSRTKINTSHKYQRGQPLTMYALYPIDKMLVLFLHVLIILLGILANKTHQWLTIVNDILQILFTRSKNRSGYFPLEYVIF
jgi:hypothetical protein